MRKTFFVKQFTKFIRKIGGDTHKSDTSQEWAEEFQSSLKDPAVRLKNPAAKNEVSSSTAGTDNTQWVEEFLQSQEKGMHRVGLKISLFR